MDYLEKSGAWSCDELSVCRWFVNSVVERIQFVISDGDIVARVPDQLSALSEFT